MSVCHYELLLIQQSSHRYQHCSRITETIMETCVLIPQEFSLCVRDALPVRRGAEPEVSVFSNSRIAQGTLCYPFQGTIRLDKLEVHGQLEDDDVSYFIIILYIFA